MTSPVHFLLILRFLFFKICRMKYCSALLLMVFSTLPLFPQFFEYGQEPASVNWKYADTENFRLIFPSGWDENTSKILWLLEKSYAQNAEEFNHRPKKIPVVIHNLSVVSNGFVAWAPKRMELFPHPDPKGYSGDRFRQLTLHEMRHVMQIDKLNQGFTRVLSTFTGEQGNGLVAGMLPMWVLEGDAILAETGHTLTGRGRLPSFEKELTALLADKPGLYSYDKS